MSVSYVVRLTPVAEGVKFSVSSFTASPVGVSPDEAHGLHLLSLWVLKWAQIHKSLLLQYLHSKAVFGFEKFQEKCECKKIERKLEKKDLKSNKLFLHTILIRFYFFLYFLEPKIA